MLSIRNRIMSGILLVLPFAITCLVVRGLFRVVFQWIRPLAVAILEQVTQIPHIGIIPPIVTSILVTILSVILIGVVLYLVGSVAVGPEPRSKGKDQK